MSSSYPFPSEEIDWNALDDPVMTGRVVANTERWFSREMAAALATDDFLWIEENGAFTWSRVFNMLYSEDEEVRADGIQALIRLLDLERRMQLHEIADDLRSITRELRREQPNIQDNGSVSRHLAALERLANRIAEGGMKWG